MKRFGKKQNYYQMTNASHSDRTPKTLLESEEAIFSVDFYGEAKWLKSMAKTAQEFNINTLKLLITTSVGQTFKIKASKSLIHAIKKKKKN